MPTRRTTQRKGKAKGSELVLTRVFDAPRERVWKAWTQPEEVKRWWGPKGFTAPFVTIDFRVGGKYLYCMRAPDGKDYWSTGVYREIVPLEKIVATDSFADPEGNVVSATHYGMNADIEGDARHRDVRGPRREDEVDAPPRRDPRRVGPPGSRAGLERVAREARGLPRVGSLRPRRAGRGPRRTRRGRRRPAAPGVPSATRPPRGPRPLGSSPPRA